MVKKYTRYLETRQLNTRTGEIWAIQDVPNTWNAQTRAKVESDGYYFAEDGTAYPNVKDED